jgi:hypothetical protein
MGLLLGSLSTVAYAGPKTDLIYLKNGDRVTGDIKELAQGQLRLSTDAFDTIFIKWSDINYISSDKWLQVELTDGTRFFGQTPEPEEGSDKFTLQTSRGNVSVDPSDVVRVESISINENFWQRLDGSVSVGFNYTQASDVAQFNLNAETAYRTRKYLASVSLDTNLTRKAEGTDTQRADLTATYLRFRNNRWFWYGSGSAQTNEELGIDFRLLSSGGIGRYLAQTARTDLQLALGLAANLEKTTSDMKTDSENDASWEGVISAEWKFYNLHTPKSNWRIGGQFYPGITDTDRNRGNLSINFSQEFWKDLFWDMNFYYSYDSKPPETALSKEDFGITTSIGYSF